VKSKENLVKRAQGYSLAGTPIRPENNPFARQ